jgi:hypothetical protein
MLPSTILFTVSSRSDMAYKAGSHQMRVGQNSVGQYGMDVEMTLLKIRGLL